MQIMERFEMWGYTSYKVFNPANGSVYKATGEQLKMGGSEAQLDENYLRYVTMLSKIVEHFYNNVRMKIKGKARAMVVTHQIQRAIEYHFAIKRELEERKSQYKPMIAFSNEVQYKGETYTEAKLTVSPVQRLKRNSAKTYIAFWLLRISFRPGTTSRSFRPCMLIRSCLILRRCRLYPD